MASAWGVAHAQSNIYDNCKIIITDGLKEYAIQTDSRAYLNSVFDKYCDNSGSAKSSSLGVGLDAVVKAIPLSFSGSYSSNEEAVRNFCRNYSSVAAGRVDTTAYQEKIVQRAYESFDQCVSLAQTGVIVRHSVRSSESLDFYLAPGFSRPVVVKGVQATSTMECRGQDPNSDNPEAKKFDLDSRVKLQDNKTLNLACTRSGRSGTNGETIYDEGVVTLLTDISPNGNYAAFVPRDLRLSETRGAEMESKLIKMNDRLSKVEGWMPYQVARVDINAALKLPPQASLAPRATHPISFSWPRSDSRQPIGGFIRPVGMGGWAELIFSLSHVTPSGGALYVHNPLGQPWGISSLTVEIVAIYDKPYGLSF